MQENSNGTSDDNGQCTNQSTVNDVNGIGNQREHPKFEFSFGIHRIEIDYQGDIPYNIIDHEKRI